MKITTTAKVILGVDTYDARLEGTVENGVAKLTAVKVLFGTPSEREVMEGMELYVIPELAEKILEEYNIQKSVSEPNIESTEKYLGKLEEESKGNFTARTASGKENLSLDPKTEKSEGSSKNK